MEVLGGVTLCFSSRFEARVKEFGAVGCSSLLQPDWALLGAVAAGSGRQGSGLGSGNRYGLELEATSRLGEWGETSNRVLERPWRMIMR